MLPPPDAGGPSPYVADHAKLKKEFGDLRADLTKILVNFRKSGQGDSAAKEAREQDEEEVRSSDFADFSSGDEIMELFYEVFNLGVKGFAQSVAREPVETKS